MPDQIVAAESRSVAMHGMLSRKFHYVGGAYVTHCKCAFLPSDGFAAGSSELVIRNFPAAGIQSAYLCLFPISWHELVASPLLSTSFKQVTLDGSPARSYQDVTCVFQLLIDDISIAHALHPGHLKRFPTD